MRIARFGIGDEVDYGIVEGEDVAPITGHPFAPFTLTGYRYPLAEVRLLAPTLPSKIVAIGKNYAEHAAEFGAAVPEAPLIFLKPSTSVVGPGAAIVLPYDSERVDFEGELAVVIGRLCKDVPAERAAEVVLGYTIANDVTARDHQRADGQWARGKGHDTFCPLGPWIDTTADPADLAITTTVDGELRQDGRTGDLVHGVGALVAYVSRAMTLLPGDLILTGTPAGVGPLAAGDEVSVTVEGIGTLTNPVLAEARPAVRP